MSEAKMALAFVARRAGVSSMPASRWAHELSLELGWMAPKQARAYVEQARAAGLLREDGDELALAFEAGDLVPPRGFRPDPDAPVETGDDFLAWVDRLGPREAILEEVTRMQERMGGLLDAEVAVLRVAAARGVDVQEASQRMQKDRYE